MTNQPTSILFLEDKTAYSKMKKKLEIMEKFSDSDYYSQDVRQHVVKKLELDDEYWKRFKQKIFDKIRENAFVVVKGLPFDENDRFNIGISSILGSPVEPYHTPDTHMIRKQTPGEVIYDQDVFPHTDGAHWPEPNDLTALECVREDENGDGFSRIVPINNVIEQLQNDGFNKIIDNFVTNKYPFLLHRSFGNKGVHEQHILTRIEHKDKDGPHVRFAARYIEEGIKKFNLSLDQQFDEVLTFEKIVSDLGSNTQFILERGDWLVFDNKRIIHSRSSAKRGSKRLLKKVKINIDRNKLFEN